MSKPPPYKIEVEIQYFDETEVLSFHIYESDLDLAKIEAVKKSMAWIDPGVRASFKIKSISECAA